MRTTNPLLTVTPATVEVARKWIAALISGKYRQATDALTQGSTIYEPRGYCCLGVLGRLLGAKVPQLNEWSDKFAGILPPDKAAEALGTAPASSMYQDQFVALNDSCGASFELIATRIAIDFNLMDEFPQLRKHIAEYFALHKEYPNPGCGSSSWMTQEVEQDYHDMARKAQEEQA